MKLSVSIEEIHCNFNQLLQIENAYGHIEDNTLIYISNGSIHELTISTPSHEPPTIEQIYGDKITGIRIIHSINTKEFKGLLNQWFSCLGEKEVPCLEEISSSLGSLIMTMKENIWSKYATDYIHVILYMLLNYNKMSGFRELYDSKFKDDIRDWLLMILNHELIKWDLIIPLLELVDKTMLYDKSDTYFEILKKMMDYKDEDIISKYIPIIARDIYKKYV